MLPDSNSPFRIQSSASSGLQPTLLRQWDDWLTGSENLYGIYQSRSWLKCFEDSGRPTPLLFVHGAAAGAQDASLITVAVPERVPLSFRIPGLPPLSLSLSCLEVLGGQSIGTPTGRDYADLLQKVWQDFPEVDALYFKSIPDNCALWKLLEENDWRMASARAYRLSGIRPFHYVQFPSTFEAYLGEFRKKQRYNLKRQVRVMVDAFAGDLKLQRLVSSDEVEQLLAVAREVRGKSWKAGFARTGTRDPSDDPEVLKAIAYAGMLRAYVLRAAGRPVAYIIGYCFDGIYHYADIGYDEAVATYSPGIVLLFMVIEDLITHAGARYLSFGITDANYKRVLGNRHIRDAAVLLMRPTMKNRALVATHGLFQDLRLRARSLAANRRKPAKRGED